MEFSHAPVLFRECIGNLNINHQGIYVDGTLGGGGHASGICEKLGEQGTLIGIDRDQDALNAAKKRLEPYRCRKLFIQSNYSDVKQVLAENNIEKVDGILLDLGVSSFQLDNPQRGFSYMQDAPLDMRMNADDVLTAQDIVNTYDQRELTEIIKKYGEEKWAARISSFIVQERVKTPFHTTFQLVNTIKAAIPAAARREGPHPAKRTFQAIRIEVNDELGQLEKTVDEAIDVLASEGRLCIITFHSLEDRIVKNSFNNRLSPCTCPKEFPMCICGKVSDVYKITGKPIISGEEELTENPRARSAKLRVIAKR
ncbi:MAG: 16S rRNA (cytosine(1402)-N(4))-methyltransferase RsmH [Anaerovorax sp.]